jgi:hypothetical protein
MCDDGNRLQYRSSGQGHPSPQASPVEEDLMPKQRLGLSLSVALLLAASAGSAAAQQSGPAKATALPAIECGGQYECIEDRPLTPAEARASLGYPQAQPQASVQREPAKVAATVPATIK